MSFKFPEQNRNVVLVKYLEVYLQKGKLDISNDKESINMYRILKTKSSQNISKTKGNFIVQNFSY